MRFCGAFYCLGGKNCKKMESMEALIKFTKEMTSRTRWIPHQRRNFIPSAFNKETGEIEAKFFSEISKDDFPFMWCNKERANDYYLVYEYLFHQLKKGTLIEKSPSLQLFQDISNHPERYPSSFQKLSWIPVMFREFNLSEALFDCPLLFNGQVIHSSNSSIQQLDLNCIGIHCNEANLIQSPQIVTAISLPQIVQRQYVITNKDNISKSHHLQIGFSYVCNDNELIVFSTYFSDPKNMLLPNTLFFYCGIEIMTRFDNLDDMCKFYSFIFGMIQRIIYPKGWKECPMYKRVMDFQKREERLRRKKIIEKRNKQKIEKQHLMKRTQPKQVDVTNLTKLLDGLNLTKERKPLSDITYITSISDNHKKLY